MVGVDRGHELQPPPGGHDEPARVGAPLGGDFCALSLSDNLKAWTTIERRLEAMSAQAMPTPPP